MTDVITQMIAFTLQNCIAKLGPMPDECGDSVKEIAAQKYVLQIMALGCCLETCVSQNSYDSLKAFVKKYKQEMVNINESTGI